MPKLHANGINFHYWLVGEGPPMVMLHGLSGNLAVWHFTTIPAFRNRYRILSYDLRGHGRSDMPPDGYTTRDMSEDLCAILDALDIERAHLVGHSLGADIALQLALDHPERVGKIVAIEAGLAALVQLRMRDDWNGWEEWAKGIEAYAGIKVPREKWTDIDYMLRESTKAPVMFGPGRGQPRKRSPMLDLLDRTTLVRDYQDATGMSLDALATLPHEVMLVYGSDSTYLGTHEVLSELIPHCTSRFVEGAAHFSLLEKPAQLLGFMEEFLDDQAPVRAVHQATG